MRQIVFDDVIAVSVIDDALFHSSLIHHIALDDHSGGVRQIDVVIGTLCAASVVVHAPFEGVAGEGHVLRIVKIYMGVFEFRGKFHAVGTAGAAENIAGDRDIAELSASAELDGGTERTVEEVSGDVDGVTVSEPESGFAVPFDTVAGRGDRSRAGTAENAGVTVGGKPVVDDEGVPAIDVQTGAAVAVEHRMAYGEKDERRIWLLLVRCQRLRNEGETKGV